MKRKGIIVCALALEMDLTHPNTDYSHVCFRCGKRVGICPSSLKALEDPRFDMDICCLKCVAQNSPESMRLYRTAESEREAREAIEFAKKQKKQ